MTSLNISNNDLGGYDDYGEWMFDMTGIKALAAAIPECKSVPVYVSQYHPRTENNPLPTFLLVLFPPLGRW